MDLLRRNICLIAVCPYLLLFEIPETQANNFIFPFPEHSPRSGGTLEHYVIVTNPQEDQVTVTLSMPLMMAVQPQQTVALQPGESRALLVTSQAMATGGIVEDKGVWVSCDKAVVVQAMSWFEYISTRGSSSSVGAFFVLPTTALSTEYLVATQCSDYTCFLLVVATEPGVTTTVSLDLQFTVVNRITHAGQNYYNGDVLQEHLEQFQVLQIQCERCDMSGTLINSNYPVTVVVGGDRTSVPGTTTRRDLVAGMLPPYPCGESKYLLAKLRASGGTYEDMIKVVVLQAGTTITFHGQTVTTAFDREKRTLMFSSESPVSLIADGPVVVVQVSDGRIPSSDTGNPALLFPRPVTQWTQDYTFAVPQLLDLDGIELVLIAETWQDGCLTAGDGSVLDTSRLTGPGAGQPAVVRMEMVAGQTGSVFSTCGPVSGFLCGYDYLRAWVMPTGGLSKASSSLCFQSTESMATTAITTEDGQTSPSTKETSQPTASPKADTDTGTATAHTTVGHTATASTTVADTARTQTTAADTETAHTTVADAATARTTEASRSIARKPPASVRWSGKHLCPCRSCEWFYSRPQNMSSAFRRALHIRDNLLVDRKAQSLYRRTKFSEGSDRDSVALVVVLALMSVVLPNLIWICCRDCKTGGMAEKSRKKRVKENY